MKARWPNRVVGFFFPAESSEWLGLLRIGLGLQLILYCIGLRRDWAYLFASDGRGLLGRDLSEFFVATDSPLIPQLGWLVSAAERIGLSEGAALQSVWFILLAAGCALTVGLYSRPAAVVAWFFHLAAASSGGLLSYGVDNFMTIGLFYLMLAPLPDRYALDRRLKEKSSPDPALLGFFRRALQLHLCLIYFFGGLAKSLGDGWWNGANLWRALTRPPFDLVPIDLILRFQHLLPALGISIVLLELGYAFFIWPQRTRLPWLALICAMHLAIGLTMGMYLFALIMLVLNLAAFAPTMAARAEVETGSPPVAQPA